MNEKIKKETRKSSVFYGYKVKKDLSEDLKEYCKYSDKVWESDENMLVIAFQNKYLSVEDEIEYANFGEAISKKYDKFVEIMVICASEAKLDHERMTYYNFICTINYISFDTLDGDKKIEEIEEKIKNNEDLSEMDSDELVLIALWKSKNTTVKQLEKIIELTNENTVKNHEFLYEIKLMQKLLVYDLVADHKKYEELKGKIKATIDKLNI